MKQKNTILVVDDDMAHRTMLSKLIGSWGYEMTEADDGIAAIEAVKIKPYDLILMDVRMIKLSGIEALKEIKVLNPAIPVIIMTAYSSVESAVKAIKYGAYDYLTKPLDFDKLKLTIARAMEHIHLKEENRLLKENLGMRFDRQNIIGQSLAITKLFDTISLVAPSEATVLITGESGTGKELIAGATHFNSARVKGPFVKINCAAIPETLLESELFGHEKGAFTGADRKKDGRFLQATGGSIFLDEITEMPLTMQVKLLRVLQEREITRVGGNDVIKVDVRIIVASNKDIQEMVASGAFREDLYYRLNVVNIVVPPLRERKEDISLLAAHFLEMFSERNHKNIKGYTPAAMDGIIKYDWPGNVRELMNAIERAVVLARLDYLDVNDFEAIQVESGKSELTQPFDTCDMPLEEIEKASILKTLESSKENKSEAARRLGITRRTLHKKLKKYGVMP
ncbi:MAG: sigma-54 dependent transcriptional regulator [Proteobacteria bacterium]|nr:sigma-54 dependent transcriptional regulator [Pseudomonadota bacterium]